MTSVDTARTVIGVIGNVISFALFASPCPTFWRIVKMKSTEEFKPDPYVATVLNCLFWIFYGLPVVHPNSTLVVTINGIGLAMEIAYLIIFFIYGNNKQRLRISAWLCIESVFFAAMAAITLLRFRTHDARSNYVGILCVIFGVMMYFSPLTIMKKVIQTRSVEYMPFYLSLTNFLNGAVWVTYALLRFDLYITIANGLGAVSGAIQLILYAVYYNSTPKTNSLPKPSAENNGVDLPHLPTATTPIHV